MGNYEKKVTYAEGIYYDKSTELKESIEILKNRNVLRLINNRLIETGVLPEYRNLVSYYLIRMDENKYWQILKPSPYVEKARTDRRKSIHLYLDKIRSLSEKELQEEAEKFAQVALRRTYDVNNYFINVIARVLDKANAN